MDAEPQVFLDPNLLSPDGTISLAGTAFSEDGKIMGYALSESGADWVTFHFKKVDDGKIYIFSC